VDSHTHPIAAPPSAPELAARMRRWMRYLGVQQALGEMPKARPEPLRTATPRALRKSALHTVQGFAMHGTTAIEARSGYGLGVGAETKGLRIGSRLDGHPLDVVTAFSVRPPSDLNDGDEDGLAGHLIEKLLPIIRRRKIASVCDVECRFGGFGPGAAGRILQAAADMGFRLKLHVDGESSLAAIEMALAYRALSIDGISELEIGQIDRLADSATIVTLLPGMSYQSGSSLYPPARDLIDRGVIVALSTGYDPAALPSFSMAGILSLACTQMRMSPAEAITAATINGAAAIGRADRLGSIEPGKQADLAIFDVADYREIPFCFGANLCSATIKKGRVIHAGPGWGGALAPLRQPQHNPRAPETPPRPATRA
jgi:imidazolonepropionase